MLLKSEDYEKNLLDDLMSVKILKVLFDKGHVDTWLSQADNKSYSVRNLPPPVVAVLERSGVLSSEGQVTPAFLELVGNRRDFFYAKLKYLIMAMQDFLESADDMLWNPERFMHKSRIFGSFDYSQGFDLEDSAREFTRSWSYYVSALSKDESGVIAHELYMKLQKCQPDFILELGGNMGVFADAMEKYFTPQSYVVIDIPQVCRLGSEYIEKNSAKSKIKFVSGNMFEIDWTIDGFQKPDIVLFKSVLHDWPSSRAAELIEKACKHLEIGGILVIVERYQFLAHNIFKSRLFDATNIVFSPFYRNPDTYISMIEKLPGLQFVFEIHSIDIDMRWFCLVARKV